MYSTSFAYIALIRNKNNPNQTINIKFNGGKVSLEKYEDGIATMFMSGACSGCASSSYTLQQGILQMLQYYIPEVKNVEKIEDPNSTVDPYYT